MSKLSFEVDANQIEIKPIMKKDFLELRMKAISTANPNRNNSWFTKESLIRSKETFRNKPILGYFENGDFVSHNGEWAKDPETDIDYWDTLGKKGERILGLVRSEDDVEIVEDRKQKGLYWIVCSCALWTQYSYKQVKRLIQDAKRAQKNGGSAKNISVEVDITDYEKLDNGVMKINDFNLIGITILGSRYGVKVEPGIEDAELSVVDIMGRDLYEKQAKGIRLAYERLDGSGKNKEEFSKVVLDENNTSIQDPALDESSTVETSTEETNTQTFESENDESNTVDTTTEAPVTEETTTAAPTVDEAPVTEEENSDTESHGEHFEDHSENTSESNDAQNDVTQTFSEDEDHNEDEKSEDEHHDDEVCPECGKNPCECEKHDGEEKTEEESCHENEGCNKSELECKYEELQAKYEALDSEHKELQQKYDACSEDYAKLAEKLHNYEHAEFLSKADKLLKSAKVEDDVAKEFYTECKEGTITTIEDLKTKVALKMFDLKTKVEETETLSTPVASIDTTAAFAGKAEKSSKNDHWSNLHEYNGK